jgi:hypothetical protein
METVGGVLEDEDLKAIDPDNDVDEDATVETLHTRV